MRPVQRLAAAPLAVRLACSGRYGGSKRARGPGSIALYCAGLGLALAPVLHGPRPPSGDDLLEARIATSFVFEECLRKVVEEATTSLARIENWGGGPPI